MSKKVSVYNVYRDLTAEESGIGRTCRRRWFDTIKEAEDFIAYHIEKFDPDGVFNGDYSIDADEMDVAAAGLEATLDQMVEYYSEDPSRRAADDPIACFYYDERTGKKCAVGRLMSEEDLNTLKDEDALSKNILSVYSLIPSIHKYPASFLNDLQLLHDCDENWSSEYGTGLSREGEVLKAEIVDKIRNGKYL